MEIDNTIEQIKDILEQARNYTDTALRECKEAQDIASVLETQVMEAHESISNSMDMLEELQGEINNVKNSSKE